MISGNRCKYTERNSKYCVILIGLVLAPSIGYTIEQPVKQIHKPPILVATAIIEIHEEDEFKGIVLIERGNAPLGKALPSGKVEYGETVEHAVRREMMEEVNLHLNELKQFHVYSEPVKDCDYHSVSVVYTAKASQLPIGGDDAAKAFVTKLEDIPWSELVFDHARVLKDYIKIRLVP